MTGLNQLESALVWSASNSVGNATRLAMEGSPGSLFEVADELEKAACAVAELERDAGRYTPEMRRRARGELERIRSQLRQVSALLVSAADFHAKWALVASRGNAAYGPDGIASRPGPHFSGGSRLSASG